MQHDFRYDKLFYDKFAYIIVVLLCMYRLKLAIILYKFIEGDGTVAIHIHTGI